MSRDNIERIRDGYAAFNREDYDAVADMLDPAVVWDASEQFDGRVYRGREGFLEYVSDVLSYWTYWRLEIDECRAIDDRVVVIGHVHAENRRYDLAAKIQVAWLWTLRDLMGTRMRVYLNPAEALQAAGLPTEADATGSED